MMASNLSRPQGLPETGISLSTMALHPEPFNWFIIAELLSIVALNRQVRLYSRALKEIITFYFSFG
jgi:hypothetical protein